ncbi:MAG: hypothetical protein P4L96_19615, partial [Rhodoferax sp.]|nr:hypothetical protein [Rhodoferax sp.]
VSVSVCVCFIDPHPSSSKLNTDQSDTDPLVDIMDGTARKCVLVCLCVCVFVECLVCLPV